MGFAVTVTYRGPTNTKGTRLFAKAYGHPGRYYARDFGLMWTKQAHEVAQDYAKSIWGDRLPVNRVGPLNSDSDVFSVG